MARFRYQRRLGLRARVTAAFGLGALFTAALLAATTFGISREQLIRQRESASSVPFFNNARNVQERLQAEGGVDALALLQDLQTTSGSHPVLFYSGDWISTDPQFGEAALPASLRRAVLDGGAAQMRYSLDGEPELGFGISLQTADDDAAYFEIVSLDETASTLTSLGIILFGASVLATGTGAALGWWASRRALLPLTEVGSAAQAIAGGRLDTRLEAANDPDLARLTESFNEMAQALETRIARDEQFASDVSHELRSPLMTLSASIEVLKARKDDLDERAGSALDLLVADVARFEQLVNDLLEISRLEAGAAELDLDPVDPSELVLHAVGAATSAAVPVQYDEEVAGTRILVDKRRMERVVANLLDNAAKYAGGATGVRVSLAEDRVRIVVEDEGPGVPEEVRQKIFDRFARGTEAGRRTKDRGVGLGLALVAEHVRLHGGQVWVEDRQDGRPGAAFVVELPAVIL
ncbi:MAG TPA: HAMP domain-containing sensor histidine kinase [Acidimicrobiales bacterium]|nr:HAMP domain-containing sensor histidine kinase [Acidimicrobiales bacterium]